MISVHDLAQEWLRLDQEASSCKEIQDLLDAGNTAELELRLRKRISFGTAGLRAAMKAGFAFMNSLTVIQVSQGLAAYVLALDPTAGPKGIVIGHDARHRSKHFASLAGSVFEAFGFQVFAFSTHVHTPMVPFAIKTLKAAAGVVVTASHNPAQDNGYKVYWSNGSQIIPPHDSGIARMIEENLEPKVWKSDFVSTDMDDLETSYFDALASSPATKSRYPLLTPPFVYTPMHGVGLPYMQRVAAEQASGNVDNMHVVEAQAEPDPYFPTLRFPNPEEKGALDLAISVAEAKGVSLVLANDPDADRFSAAERLPNGLWHQFTGNQLGILLASHVFNTFPGDKSKLAMLASTVSSRMLAVMAEKTGFHFRETLTGFKWLGNVAQQLKAEGWSPAFAFEEAIGFMFSDIVYDKDGIAAASAFLAACQRWKKSGLTPFEKLKQLYERYGHFEDANTYIISPSPEVTSAVFEAIRNPRPSHLAVMEITRLRDLTIGFDSATEDSKPDLPVDPTAQMITCELEDSVRFTVRGSGTEPKIKLYVEAQAASRGLALNRAREVQEDLLKSWFKVGSGNRLRLAVT